MLPDLPPFAVAPLDPVEKLLGLFAREHHADITRRNPPRALGIQLMAFDKRHTFVNGIIRDTTRALISEAASTITTPCNRPCRV
jgi:hypothetical protein